MIIYLNNSTIKKYCYRILSNEAIMMVLMSSDSLEHELYHDTKTIGIALLDATL